MSRPIGRRVLLGPLGVATAAVVAAVSLTASPASSQEPLPSVGRPATPAEISRWDVDSSPTGAALPPGQGNARLGAGIFTAKCAGCHGDNGEGGIADRLVGGDRWTVGAPRTVGNYWPYATTLVDYVYRAMPFNAPNSLTPDEAYAVSAWILYQNGIVGEDEALNRQTVARIEMPGRTIFVPDPRPDAQP